MRASLINKHEQKIKKLNEISRKNQNNKKHLNYLYKELSRLEQIPKFKRTNQELDSYFDIKNKIRDLEKNIIPEEEKIRYFIETKDILFNYYKHVDNPQLSENLYVDFQKGSIADLFQQMTNEEPLEKKIEDAITTVDPSQLLDNYLKKTESNYIGNIKIKNVPYCDNCKVEMIIDLNNGQIICSKCGLQKLAFIDCDKPSYKEPTHEMSYYPYKRINHFNEILAQLQGKENTTIPQDVYDKIKIEIKKDRLSINDIDETKIRYYLKKLGFNKYYEHIQFIHYQLSGQPPLLTPEIEDRMRTMFRDIQGPYSECPLTKNRKNFISYYYVLYKFFQLLEINIQKNISLLKSKERLSEHDKIWKYICEKLGWKFIPSI